jgi:hypothetical protein
LAWLILQFGGSFMIQDAPEPLEDDAEPPIWGVIFSRVTM